MKVKDLIKILSDFNPNTIVLINKDGIEKEVSDYAWKNGNGEDSLENKRDIDYEKLNSATVSLYMRKENENI